MTAFSPAFQVDTDHVGSVLAYVGYINTRGNGWDATPGGTGGQTISFWTGNPTLADSSSTTLSNGFVVGQTVEVRGLPGDYAAFNGVHTIIAVGDTDQPNGYFSVHFPTNLPSVSVDSLFAGLVLADGNYDWSQAQALSPPPSYIRYHPHDTLLDAATAHTTFYVEPWDYNTIRVVWGVDASLDTRADLDLGNGLVPRMVITRSGFGIPSTPLDGERVLIANYGDVITTPNRRQTSEYFETQVAHSNDWNRPPVPIQGLYDRNLPSGKWFYYSLFFHLGSYDAQGVPLSFNPMTGLPAQVWVLGNSMSALTPINHLHAERLYELIPDYYQMKDQEFLAGTGRQGVVQRMVQSVGFDADYTKTLTDGLEHAYDIDYVSDALMYAQGVSNFGVPLETGLGDIRYRSLLATVSKLYEERGSASGLQKMTTAATKYRCKVIEGVNRMNLTDDAEFSTDTGSWGNVVPEYGDFARSHSWLGRNVTSFNAVNLVTAPLLTTPEGSDVGSSLVLRRNALLVGTPISADFDSPFLHFDDPSRFDGVESGAIAADVQFDDDGTNFDYPVAFDGASAINSAVLLACGLGQGFRHGRRHERFRTGFFPRLHGIKCHSNTVFTFSGYSVLKASGIGPTGPAGVGIMWFNDDQNGYFNIERDFIAKTESDPRELEARSLADDAPGPFKRFSVDSKAPVSLRGQPFVFAVPYFIFSNSTPRYVSACMFHEQLNSAETFAIPSIQYLRLGVPVETLDSEFVLGEDR